MYKKLKNKPSHFGQWIVDYVDKNNMTLSDLARMSGLTLGALRSLIVFPDRVPTLETCVRLASATGTPVKELLDLAGVTSPENPEGLHPERLQLLAIYDALPGPLKASFFDLARNLQKVATLSKDG
jgi:transcriptional regulator with XRE-family HTH domain